VQQRGGHSVPSRRWVDGQAPKWSSSAITTADSVPTSVASRDATQTGPSSSRAMTAGGPGVVARQASGG
jgi:hypothetical protein